MKMKDKQIRMARKKMGRPTKRPDMETLVNLYERHTSTEIADMYHVKASTVRTWVSRAKKEGVLIE